MNVMHQSVDKVRRTALIVLAAGTLPGAAVSGQVQDSLTLTLEDALQIATVSNPAYRRASNELDIKTAETRNAWFSGIVPSVNLGLLGTGYEGTLQRRGVDFFGNPVENPISDWVYSSNTTQFVQLNWRIQGWSIFNRHDEQEVTNLGRDLAMDRTAWTLQAQIRRLYADIMEQLELFDAEEGNLVARQLDLQSAERIFRLALNTRVDVLQAELQIQQQEGAIQERRRGYEQALLALRTVLGDPDLPPFRIAPGPLVVFDPTALDEEALVAQALAGHPDVRVARANVRGAEVARRQRNDARWPSLNVRYQLGRQARTGEAQALFDVTYDENDLFNNFGISVSIPYFSNFFQNRLADAQADVAARNRQQSLTEARLQTEQRVRSQLIELRNQYQTLQYRERALAIAEEALSLAREEYRLGSRTFTEVQQSIEQEVNARRDLLQTRFLFYDALVNLEEAGGAPIPIPPPIADGANGNADVRK